MLAFIMFDPFYLLLVLLPSLALGGWAQWRMRRAYAQASQIQAPAGMTGAEAAAEILRRSGLSKVRIESVEGSLTDHYDPSEKVLRLSKDNYYGRSMAALGVSAHEAGHALQDAQGYFMLNLRSLTVPAAQFGSPISSLAFMIGLGAAFMGAPQFGASLVLLAVIAFTAVVLFQVITLPVEFDASRRAREELHELKLVPASQAQPMNSMLNAAAMTYVAATVVSILNLLYYLWWFFLLSGQGEE